MLEFVIAFPVILVLMLACIQFAHLWVARQVVHYAAYCAARAALVCRQDEYQGANAGPQRAAEQVCAWIGFGVPGGPPMSIPGWGSISGSEGVAQQTRVTVTEASWNISATVAYDFSMIVPVVGPLIKFGSSQAPWFVAASGLSRQTQQRWKYPSGPRTGPLK